MPYSTESDIRLIVNTALIDEEIATARACFTEKGFKLLEILYYAPEKSLLTATVHKEYQAHPILKSR